MRASGKYSRSSLGGAGESIAARRSLIRTPRHDVCGSVVRLSIGPIELCDRYHEHDGNSSYRRCANSAHKWIVSHEAERAFSAAASRKRSS